MKLAVDCRMYGKSGIGSFLAGVLPFLCADEAFERVLLLAGPESLPLLAAAARAYGDRMELVSCGIRTFSLRELLLFPLGITAQINACDCYFTPYCNIPSGIRIPVYSTIHDLVFLDFPGLTGRAGVFVRKCLYCYAVFRSKALFTVSEFSRGRILALLHCKKPVYVSCNGVPRFLEEAKQAGRLDGWAEQKDAFVLFVGNIKAHKGLLTLLNAFPLFRAKTGARLVIVGSAENFRTKDAETERLLAAGGGGITFTGHVSDEQLAVLLASARLLVQPSLYEGFGIPPLEAMYCGTKAVISDIPVFRELYGAFPVSFFRAGDAADLAAKMEAAWQDSSPLPPLPDSYSYKKAAAVIAEQLKACNERDNPVI